MSDEFISFMASLTVQQLEWLKECLSEIEDGEVEESLIDCLIKAKSNPAE